MGLAALAVADVAITFLWVLYIAYMRLAASLIAAAFNLYGYEFPIVMGLLALNIFVFSRLGGMMGGALWNPATVFAFYLVGASKDTAFSLAVRLPAQTVGAVAGVFAAKELMPASHSHFLRGPQLMVDFYKGTLAEVCLTFLITFAVLFAVFKGPRSQFLKTWVIILATYGVVLMGSSYTGPALNPVHAFAWAYANGNHYNLEHLFVFWLAPLLGAYLAAWIFQIIFRRDRPKQKAA